jgi:hypothetical protein
MLWMVLSATAMRPSGSPSTFDPDYYYLLSALDIVQQRVVGLYHHPGTTAELFGAAVIRVMDSSAASVDDVETAVFTNPEAFFSGIYWATAVLIALSLLTVGIVTMRYTGNALLTIAFQLSPFVSSLVLIETLSHFKAEPFLLVEYVLLIAVIGAWIYDEARLTSHRFWIASALICGAGIATKLTFIPALVIPLVLLSGWKHRGLFVVGTVVTAGILMWPIRDELSVLRTYLSGVTFHTGLYASGKEGLIDFRVYGHNFVDFLRNYSFAVGIVVFGAATFFIARGTPRRALLALLLTHLVGIALMTKYYLTPGTERYFMASFCLLGPTIIVSTISLVRSGYVEGPTARRAFGIALAAILVWGESAEVRAVTMRVRQLRSDETLAQQRVMADALAWRPGYAKIVDVTNQTYLWGLFYGSTFSASHRPALKRLFPDVYFCDSRCDKDNWTTKVLVDFANYSPFPVPVNVLRERYRGKIAIVHADSVQVIEEPQ